jgi:hypothetical protein
MKKAMIPVPFHKNKPLSPDPGQFSEPVEIKGRSALYRIVWFSAIAFTIISVLAVFVPFDPVMPRQGLDPSWKFAMNEAVAQHLDIGRDIMFNFGPYSYIYTRVYHPDGFVPGFMLCDCLNLPYKKE